MSSTILMNSDEGRDYATSPLTTRWYSSTPNIMLLTPAETAEKKIKAPSTTTAKSKSLPAKLNAAGTVTCVNLLRGTAEAAIKGRVVPTNAVFKPRSRPHIVSSTMSLNDMNLDVAQCRWSRYATSRLEKVYFSTPNIALMTAPETANRVPSSTAISPADDGVENHDRTMQERSDSGHLCAETPEHKICGNDGPAGSDHGGQTCKNRSLWKRTKTFFRSLLCCTSYSSEQ